MQGLTATIAAIAKNGKALRKNIMNSLCLSRHQSGDSSAPKATASYADWLTSSSSSTNPAIFFSHLRTSEERIAS
jgi:hypothetical protein